MPALLLLGAGARCRQYLAASSYWHDEAFLLLNIYQKSFLDLVGPLTHDQAAPPLFLWMLKACYLTGGPSELAMRLPALLASLAALMLMAPLARIVVGPNGWLWAVACSCVSSSLLFLTYQVKPYTTDVLVSEAVLLASVAHLTAGGKEKRRLLGGGLVATALVAPWLSFPSVFVLGGACAALLVEAHRAGDRRAWMLGVAAPAALLVSCVALWLVAARHHNTPYQQSFWAADFMDRASLAAALAWYGRKLVELGNYGIQGTGIPMALLAAVGLAGCWRRQPSVALALVGPALLACVAAALRQYPFGNRLLAFLLPCLWLCAAQGVGALACRLPRRAAWPAAAFCVLLLLPGAVRTALYAVVAKPSVEFRQAFDCVHQQWREGDTLWVSQPEVYEAYFGRRANLIGGKSPRRVVERAAAQGRIWMVCHPTASETTLWNEARGWIESSAVEVDRRRFVHLEVSTFAPRAPHAARR